MPSNKILEQKQEVVRVLAEKLRSCASGVLVQYQGIKVADDTAMRAAMRKAGVEYAVIKNTMIGRALKEAGIEGLDAHLNGMTALAISTEDAVAPAKILKEYAEKVEGFELKAGFLDGAVLDVAGVEALAAIPSKEVLIAKMLGSLMAPLYSFSRVLQAKIDKENEEAPAEA